MAAEQINNLEALFKHIDGNEIAVWANGGSGTSFINFLRYTGRANVCCIVQENKAATNKFFCDIPVLCFKNMPHFRETATFIVAAPASKRELFLQKLNEYGCKKIFCLTDEFYNELKNELKKLNESGAVMAWTMNYFAERLNRMEYQLNMNQEICKVNTAAFEAYRNCYYGKKIVIVGTGETAKYYKPMPDAIHIGLDKVCQRDDIALNYLFTHTVTDGGVGLEKSFHKVIDRVFVGKFVNPLRHDDEYSEYATVSSDKVARYFAYDDSITQMIYQDICSHPLAGFGGALGAALQFAVFTFPSKIYLVGCEAAQRKYGVISKVGFIKLKTLAKKYYPSTEIISVNPIEMKSLFKEIQTKEMK